MPNKTASAPEPGRSREQAVAYLNGEWLATSEATLPLDDRGFIFGDCLYDIVSAWKGTIFRLDDHLDRFFASMRATRLDSPITREEWRRCIVECARRNGLRDASIRMMITRGPPAPATEPADFLDLRAFVPNYRPTTIVTAAPYYYLADKRSRENGIRLWVCNVRALPADTVDPRYKTHSRLHFQLARLEALEAGYDDAVLLDERGCVTEGPASNVFVVRRGTIYTPARGVLCGITRMTLLEITERLALPCVERDLTPSDLFTADEVFTASTGGGLLPVRSVSGRAPELPAPGPVTQRVHAEYWRMRSAGEHGTPIYPPQSEK